MRNRAAAAAVIAALIGAGCGQRAGQPGDRPALPPPSATVAVPDTFTLLVYNVQNLFDLVDDGTEYREFDPGSGNWDSFGYETRMKACGAAIASARPDIAVLCELENANMAKGLQQRLKNAGLRLDHAAVGDKPNAAATVPTVLSVFPIITVNRIGTIKVGGYFSRNILEVVLRIGSDTLTVFANHWPSKRHAGTFRVAVAEILLKRLSQLPAGADYIVAGDLNEDYDERGTPAALPAVLGTAAVGDGPRKYSSERDMTGAMPGRHYDLWLELKKRDRMSYVFKGRPGTPDHIILPPSLYDGRGISYLDNSFAVHTWDGRLLKNGRPYDWRVRRQGAKIVHPLEVYSDHLPLVARFYRGPFRQREAAPTARDAAEEDGPAEWIGAQDGISVLKDSVEQSCFRITGVMGGANATVARMTLPAQSGNGRPPRRLTLRLKGSGAFCFRLRQAETQKWGYVNPPAFAVSGSARYAQCEIPTWRTVAIPLAGRVAAGEEIEFEIRGQKNAQLSLMIESVRVE